VRGVIVGEVLAGELISGQQVIDKTKTLLQTFAHDNGHGAVQFDNRGWLCDHWDLLEKRPRPPAPYLIQGIRHPSAAGIQTIRSRIREISIGAEASRSDGSSLVLLPHDCRRVFASEHLNNNTPVHVIQALLGHVSPDTVMIYAKLYPGQLIEEYRKTVRSLL
jgi:integrase